MTQDPFPVGLFYSLLRVFDSPGFHLILLAIFAAAVIAIVRTAPGNICLGVNIPPDKFDEPACRRLRRRFGFGVVILAVLAGGAIWLSAMQMPKVNLDAVVFSNVQVLFFVGVLVWFHYVIRRSMFKLAERKGWFTDREPGKVVIDTSFHQKKKSLSPFWLLSFPLIIFMTLSAYQYWRPELYSSLFQPVFDEFGFRNVKLTIFGEFSAGGVITFLKNLAFYLQIMFTVFTVLVFFIVANTRQSLDPADPTGSLEEELRRRKKSQIILLVAYAVCMIAVAIIPFAICRNAIVPLFAYGFFPLYAATVLFLLYFVSRMGKTPTAKSGGKKRQNRLFYSNADDPALFLWSRTGVGFVMNIARPTVKIICVGFCLLAVGLLWYVVAYQPMTSSDGFFPPVDLAIEKRCHPSDDAETFLQAAYHNGTIMTPEVQDSYRHPLSVIGKIELIEVTSHFPSSHLIGWRSNHFRDKLRDYLDGKITLDDFGEHYTFETVREENVVFGIVTVTADGELQNRREQGLFDDEQFPALTEDGETLYRTAALPQWRKKYEDYQFETMGQMQGTIVQSLLQRFLSEENDRIFAYEHHKWNLHQYRDSEWGMFPQPYDYHREFQRDALIVKYYHGKDLFAGAGGELYDGDKQGSVLGDWNDPSRDKKTFAQKYRVLVDTTRDYASPYGWFSHSWGVEAWRASEYFRFGAYRWVPRNYTAFKFSFDKDSVADSVQIVRVTLDPDTIRENRKYRETWDEQTQTRMYVETDESQEIGR